VVATAVLATALVTMVAALMVVAVVAVPMLVMEVKIAVDAMALVIGGDVDGRGAGVRRSTWRVCVPAAQPNVPHTMTRSHFAGHIFA